LIWVWRKGLEKEARRKKRKNRRRKNKKELECLKLEFHMDFKSTLALPTHRTRVSLAQVAIVNSSLRDSRC